MIYLDGEKLKANIILSDSALTLRDFLTKKVPEHLGSQLLFGNVRDYAFYQYNSSKTPVSIDCSMTTRIGDYAFRGCQYLSTAEFGPMLTSIGRYAFYDTRLTYADLRKCNSLVSIGYNAFYHVYTVLLDNPVPPLLDSRAFLNPANVNVYVPAELVETYQNADGWKDCNIIEY